MGLQFTQGLREIFPRTEHCSKSKTILPKECMSDHGETVLSEGKDQSRVLVIQIERAATLPYLLIRFNLVKSKIRFTPARIMNAREPAPESHCEILTLNGTL